MQKDKKKFAYVKKKQYLCSRFRVVVLSCDRYTTRFTGSSSARLECLLWEQEVVSSNLAYPTKRKSRTWLPFEIYAVQGYFY